MEILERLHVKDRVRRVGSGHDDIRPRGPQLLHFGDEASSLFRIHDHRGDFIAVFSGILFLPATTPIPKLVFSWTIATESIFTFFLFFMSFRNWKKFSAKGSSKGVVRRSTGTRAP